jgi:hypothetical protein
VVFKRQGVRHAPLVCSPGGVPLAGMGLLVAMVLGLPDKSIA